MYVCCIMERVWGKLFVRLSGCVHVRVSLGECTGVCGCGKIGDRVSGGLIGWWVGVLGMCW